MKTADIREKFLQFWESKNHKRVESSSLIPVEDPTLLFVNAGMVQFKDVFIGNSKRDYKRAVSCQRCIRAGGKHNDLEEVGYTRRHHTLFEMLGNFSFGDYFKKEACAWSLEFLTVTLGLPLDKLYFSILDGDEEARRIWLDLNISPERIYSFGEKDNFWMMGEVGPCGPNSEIFYDLGPEVGISSEDVMGGHGDRFMEIWNNVFMQYEATADGCRVPLPNPSIDTGMGLERIACVMQGVLSNYEIDLFVPLLKAVQERVKSQKNPAEKLRFGSQVMADHVRAASFLIADGILPSNLGRGYVLRRILRRAVRHSYQLGIREPFLCELARIVMDSMGDFYTIFRSREDFVVDSLRMEEEGFLRTLQKGLDLLDEEIKPLRSEGKKELSGKLVFKLYDTFGFPKDLTTVILKEHQMTFSETEFNELMAKQREQARSAGRFGRKENWPYTVYKEGVGDAFCGYEKDSSQTTVLKAAASPDANNFKLVLQETPFYAESGGQVGDSGFIYNAKMRLRVIDTQKEESEFVHYCELLEGNSCFTEPVVAEVDGKRRFYIRRHHTAVHLLQSILRSRFGEHIQQAGSYVDEERFRFDFTHNKALTDDEITMVEKELFEQIHNGCSVMVHNKSLEEARNMGAICPFGEKYGDMVRVLEIPGISMEFCGGIHVQDIAEIGMVHILSESSIAAGVRRIEGTVSKPAFLCLQSSNQELEKIRRGLSIKEGASERVFELQENLKKQEKEIRALRQQLLQLEADKFLADSFRHNDFGCVSGIFNDADGGAFREVTDNCAKKMGSGVLVFANRSAKKVSYICRVSPDLVSRGLDAAKLLAPVAELSGGRGGGRGQVAQAGGNMPEKTEQALALLPKILAELQNC